MIRLFSNIDALNPFQKKGLQILTYHGIIDDFTHPRLQRNFHSMHQFSEQIDYLKSKRYKFLSASELVDFASADDFYKAKKVTCITFDDGYKNNLKAIEYLIDSKLPGIIFLSTEAINTNHSIWTVNLSLLILQGNLKQLIFNNEVFSLSSYEERLVVFNTIRYFLKDINAIDRKAHFEIILNQFPENEIERLLELHSYFKMLTWDEIRAVQSEQIQFQSHGHFHEIHNEVQLKEIIDEEVKLSKAIIEKELKNRVNIFAFPNGNCKEESQKILEKNNYKIGLALGNKEVPNPFNKFMMPRFTPDHKFVKFKKQLK